VNVIFLSVDDLGNSRYRREGSRNLLDTGFGAADTLAFCGRLESARKTRYGPRLEINDSSSLTVIVGTFNINVRGDAEKIVEEFREEGEVYLLLYGSPYEKDRLYINVNQDNGVIPVDRITYERFHELRRSASDYLLGKLGTTTFKEKTEEIKAKPLQELPNPEIINFIKSRDRGAGVKLNEILEHFKNFEGVEDKILEIMELGELYEPKAGIFKVLE
jgi:hypothetical protein